VATPVCNHFKSKEESFAGSLSTRGILAIFEGAMHREAHAHYAIIAIASSAGFQD
jgi:hypothetical protein